MSSKKGKTKVSQADLRRMMNQKKNERSASESLNGKTQGSQKNGIPASLKRSLAGSYVKSNQETKKFKSNPNVSNSSAPKTANLKSHSDVSKHYAKLTNQAVKQQDLSSKVSSKTLLSNVNTATSKPQKINNLPSKKLSSSAANLVSGFYSDSEDSSEENQNSHLPSDKDSSKTKLGDVPSTSKTGITNPVTTGASKKDTLLPEGFFDDPEVDAKIRGVETPADKMDREWESFQRELQHETGQSEQLIEEEHETGHLDREITEIDEQMHLYNLMDKLYDKKEAALNEIKHDMIKKEQLIKLESSDSSADDADDDDDESSLYWRKKDAFT